MDIRRPQFSGNQLSAYQFREALLASSQSLLVRSILEKDGDYLLRAYEHVEELWHAQFRDIERVNLVLLSEAPLFGQKRSYIYNPEAGVTSFFNYKDYSKAFDGYGPPLLATGPVKARKTGFLKGLRELGVLIVDLFPFALNKATRLNYSTLRTSEHTELFEATCPAFFRLKLESILRKATPQTLFAFRYERLRRACEKPVRTEFGHFQISPTRIVSESISAPRGIIRHEPLRAVYERSRQAVNGLKITMPI